MSKAKATASELADWLNAEADDIDGPHKTAVEMRAVVQYRRAAAELRRLERELDCGCGVSGCRNTQRKCANCRLEEKQDRIAELEEENGMLTSAIRTPEIYVGIITEQLEQERDDWAVECKKLQDRIAKLEEENEQMLEIIQQANPILDIMAKACREYKAAQGAPR